MFGIKMRSLEYRLPKTQKCALNHYGFKTLRCILVFSMLRHTEIQIVKFVISILFYLVRYVKSKLDGICVKCHKHLTQTFFRFQLNIYQFTDATCVPANIRFPQDVSLLNEPREKLEIFVVMKQLP